MVLNDEFYSSRRIKLCFFKVPYSSVRQAYVSVLPYGEAFSQHDKLGSKSESWDKIAVPKIYECSSSN